ncbi:MAG: hypothetical protein MUE85_13410 [Microscillaceae bacterium]|nr:hypothetical protein [Microscillaceae bacterium]
MFIVRWLFQAIVQATLYSILPSPMLIYWARKPAVVYRAPLARAPAWVSLRYTHAGARASGVSPSRLPSGAQ